MTTAARKRRRPWRLPAAVLIAAAVIAALLTFRAEIAERAAVLWLDRIGIGGAHVSVEHLGLRTLHLRDVSLGDSGPSLQRAEITYSLADLLRGGSLDEIVIHGLDLTVDLGPSGVAIDGLPPLGPMANGSIGLPALPSDKVILRDFALRLDAPDGAVRISGDATVEPRSDAGIAFTTALVAAGDPGAVDMTASGQLVREPSGTLRLQSELDGRATSRFGATRFAGTLEAISDVSGDIAGEVLLADAGYSHEAGTASGLVGRIRFRLGAGEMYSIEADVGLGSARVSGIEIGESRFDVTYRNGELEAAADVQWEGGSLKLGLAPSEAAAQFPYALDLDGSVDAGWLAGFAGWPAEANGTFEVALAGRLVDPGRWMESGPITPARVLRAGSLRGRIVIDIGAGAVPDVAAVDSLSGTLAIRLGEGLLELRVEEEIHAKGIGLAPGVVDSRPEAAGLFGGTGFALSIGGAGPTRIAVRAEDGGEATVEATASGSASGAGTTVAFDASARTRLDRNLAMAGPLAATVTASASDLTVAGMTGGGSVVVTDFALAPDSVSGHVEIDVAASGRPASDIQLRDVTLKLAGSLDLRDGRIHFLPTGDGHIGVGRVDAGRFRVTRPIAVTLEAGSDPQPIVHDRSGLTGSLHTGPLDIGLTVRQPNPFGLRFIAGGLDLEADNGTYRLSLSGGRLDASEQQLALKGLDLRATLHEDRRFTARLNAAEVTHLQAPPWFVPLQLSARVNGTTRRATFDGEIFDPGRRLVITASGSHSLETGHGEAVMRMQPVSFIPTVLQPRQLFPATYRFRAELDGRFEAHAEARWDSGGLRSSGVLDADITELSTSEIEIRDAATTLRFDSLAPPSTEVGQSVSIKELNVGLPLTDGLFDLELHPDGRVTGRIVRLNLFGGRIRTDPFVFDPEAQTTEINLEVEEIGLAEFLAFAEFGEMEATGTLRGTIPIVIENGEVSIRNGELETAEGGVLRYSPSGIGGALEQVNEATEVLVKAIRNFRYSRVRILMNETSAEEMTFKLILEGMSPDVYDGLPLVLNVNISGPLRDIVGRGLKTYQLPAEVGRQLEGRAR